MESLRVNFFKKLNNIKKIINKNTLIINVIKHPVFEKNLVIFILNQILKNEQIKK